VKKVTPRLSDASRRSGITCQASHHPPSKRAVVQAITRKFYIAAIWSGAHASFDKNQVAVILKKIARGLSLTMDAAAEFFQNQIDVPRLVTVQPRLSRNFAIGQHCCLIEVKDYHWFLRLSFNEQPSRCKRFRHHSVFDRRMHSHWSFTTHRAQHFKQIKHLYARKLVYRRRRQHRSTGRHWCRADTNTPILRWWTKLVGLTLGTIGHRQLAALLSFMTIGHGSNVPLSIKFQTTFFCSWPRMVKSHANAA
jgi:hypothetical protein